MRGAIPKAVFDDNKGNVFGEDSGCWEGEPWRRVQLLGWIDFPLLIGGISFASEWPTIHLGLSNPPRSA